jgi:hypoxanthine phosphoribosyltransferase
MSDTAIAPQVQAITPELIKKVLETSTQILTHKQLIEAFDRMTDKIRPILHDANPVLLTVMNGGLMPSSEMAMRLHFPLQMDYVHATRYTGDVTGKPEVKWKRSPNIDLQDRTVLVIDDILDGGLTMRALVERCYEVGAKKVYTAAILDKVEGRVEGGLPKADFTGIEIPNEYVFGFGCDYHDYLRNLPGIYTVAPQYMF